MYVLKIHVMKLYRGVWYVWKSFRSEAEYIEKAPSCSGSLTIGFSREEEILTADTIRKLLTKWVIPKCSHRYGELLSSYLCDKSIIDSTFRFILNLKSLRDANSPISIEPQHTRLLFNADAEWLQEVLRNYLQRETTKILISSQQVCIEDLINFSSITL